MNFSIKDFFRKCDKIRSLMPICSYLLKNFLTEERIFCALALGDSSGQICVPNKIRDVNVNVIS